MATGEVSESLIRRLAGPSVTKAGLKRDPREVGQIIYEASKGSKYYENERRRDEETSKRVEAMLKRRAELDRDPAGERDALEAANRILQDLESTRDLNRVIVVVDADAFYASCHELDDPSLKGKAFGVGSGVLTTASYEARRYGCRSAMAGYIASILCPHLIFVKPDFSKYTVASKSIMDVLSRYDANYAPASLDEAYMDITTYVEEHQMSPDEVVAQMRAEVLNTTGLTVSAGVSPNKMLSKIAADVNKPNGQFVIRPDRTSIMDFMGPMAVRKIPGIGKVNERILDGLGIKTCNDIYRYRSMLYQLHSEIGFQFLMRAYLGIGSTHVEPGKREDRKSLGCETTFADLMKPEDLYEKLREISNDLADDVERTGFGGKTLTWKFKLNTYEVFTRATTPASGKTFQHSDDIYSAAKALMDKEIAVRGSIRVRLMGLRLNNMVDLRAVVPHGKGRLDQWFKKRDQEAEMATIEDVDGNKLDLDGPAEEEEESALAQAEEEWSTLQHAGECKEARITSGLAFVTPTNPIAERQRLAEQEQTKRSLIEQEAAKPPSITCPVCLHVFRVNEDEFNTHLDLCLNGVAVKAAVRQQEGIGKSGIDPPKKRSSPFEAMARKPPKKGNVR